MAASLGTATMAAADDRTLPGCRGIGRLSASLPEVTESWPLVLRNAFAADGTGHEYLTVTVLHPIQRGTMQKCLAPYLAGGLVKSDDGTITGQIIPTSMDYPVFFGDTITIDPAFIVDWSYARDVQGPKFGGFQMRHLYRHVSTKELSALSYSPDPVPADWR